MAGLELGPEEVARWLTEQARRPICFEKIEPGDEQILPSREQRELDAVDSLLALRRATMSLAAGVSLFSLARRMGTSVEMIDSTYGHLAPDAEDYERGLLDAYDSREIAAEEEAR